MACSASYMKNLQKQRALVCTILSMTILSNTRLTDRLYDLVLPPLLSAVSCAGRLHMWLRDGVDPCNCSHAMRWQGLRQLGCR